jgi:predicted NBD/HSP70 family sugar kinase
VYIGVDIGGTKTEGVVLAADGQVVASDRIPTVRGARGVVEGVHTIVGGLMAAVGASADEVEGLGIGVPGVVDDAGVTRHAVNLGVTQLDLAGVVSASYPFRVSVANDVRAAALGAHLLNAEQATSLGYLNLGTGVAAGFVRDGRPWAGASGVAGEVGHLPIDRNGPLCKCGQRGCVEAYAGGAAIAARWATDALHPVVDLFDAADMGRPAAVELRDELVEAVYRAVLAMVLTVDVDLVVLGGGTTRLGRRLIDPVVARATEVGEASAFINGLRLRDRIRLAPAHVAITAVGAAALARSVEAADRRWEGAA